MADYDSSYERENNEQTGASLLDILEEVTELVAGAKSMPLSASVLVNQSQMLDLLETARAIVPQQIVDADSVLQDASAVTNEARSQADVMIGEAQRKADALLAHARKEAEGIVAQAEQKAAQLVERDAVTAAARSQAAQIIDEANRKAHAARRGADVYSDKSLSELAAELESVQEQIDALQDQILAGRDVLAQRLKEKGA